MDKGKYGYIENHKKKLLISIIVLGLVIIVGVFFSVALFGTRKNLFIILPILTCIPFAKQIVLYIMCANFKPLSKEEYNIINDKIDYASSNDLIYDLSFSRYEGILYFPVAVIRNGRILLLYNSAFKKKYPDNASLKKEIENSLVNRKDSYVVVLTTSLKEFISKANSIKAPTEEFLSRDKKVRNSLFELGV